MTNDKSQWLTDLMEGPDRDKAFWDVEHKDSDGRHGLRVRRIENRQTVRTVFYPFEEKDQASVDAVIDFMYLKVREFLAESEQ